MRKFTLEQGGLYVSNDIARDWPIKGVDDAQKFFDERLDLLFDSQPKFREYIDLHGRVRHLNGYGILTAHGNANGRWMYYDDDDECDVQDWIDRYDGKYAGLLLCVCNPGHHTPRIKKSVLLVADRVIWEGPDIDNPAYSLLVRGREEINSYTIEFEIEQLRKQLEQSENLP